MSWPVSSTARHQGATYKDAVADVKSAIRYLAPTPRRTASTEQGPVWDSPPVATSPRCRRHQRPRAVEDGSNPARAARFRRWSTSSAVRHIEGRGRLRPGGQQRELRGRPTHSPSSSSGRTRRCRSRRPGRDGLGEPAHLRQKVSPPFVLLHGSGDQLVYAQPTLILQKACGPRVSKSTR